MEKLKKMKCTFQMVCDRIKDVKDNICFYKKLLEKPQGKAAVSNIKRQCLFLWKKMRPKKIEGELIFGTGDPASTGQMLGAIAVFYGFYPEKLQIVPDFEEARFEGDIQLKGQIRLFYVIVTAIRLIADKNVRYMMKKINSRKDYKK